MCFIFKQQEPWLFHTIGFHFDLYRAGVDLFGFIQLFQKPFLPQILRCQRSDIEQAHRFLTVHLFPDGKILLIGFLYILIIRI